MSRHPSHIPGAVLLLVFSLSLLPRSAAYAADTPLDAKTIGSAAGAVTSAEAGGVVKIGWSRDDVAVKVDGMPLPPGAGLGSWAAFTPMAGGDAMVMGDTVVFQDEVDAAMDAAFAHGLELTALHNHFFYDEPRVFFMHIGGEGDPTVLAQGVKAVWDASRTEYWPVLGAQWISLECAATQYHVPFVRTHTSVARPRYS